MQISLLQSDSTAVRDTGVGHGHSYKTKLKSTTRYTACSYWSMSQHSNGQLCRGWPVLYAQLLALCILLVCNKRKQGKYNRHKIYRVKQQSKSEL